jgi:predicted P-loop ATPase
VNLSSDIVFGKRTNRPLATRENLQALLHDDPVYGGGALRYNLLKRRIEHAGKPYREENDVRIVEYLDDTYRVSFPLQFIGRALMTEALKHEYCPVYDYLSGLAWDGVSRFDSLLTDVLRVVPSPSDLGDVRDFFVGAVARRLSDDPAGVEMKTLIISGAQGTFKSTFVALLARGGFSDSTFDYGKPDGYGHMLNTWFMDWGILDRFNRGGARRAALCAFLAARRDTYRLPYAKQAVTTPRRCVMVETTNDEWVCSDEDEDKAQSYRDQFLVLYVGCIDIPLFKTMRDQIWAEAVYLYRKQSEQ